VISEVAVKGKRNGRKFEGEALSSGSWWLYLTGKREKPERKEGKGGTQKV